MWEGKAELSSPPPLPRLCLSSLLQEPRGKQRYAASLCLWPELGANIRARPFRRMAAVVGRGKESLRSYQTSPPPHLSLCLSALPPSTQGPPRLSSPCSRPGRGPFDGRTSFSAPTLQRCRRGFGDTKKGAALGNELFRYRSGIYSSPQTSNARESTAGRTGPHAELSPAGRIPRGSQMIARRPADLPHRVRHPYRLIPSAPRVAVAHSPGWLAPLCARL